MKHRRLWAVSALDLVFLVLGSVLLLAKGFERGIDHVRVDLPQGASADGRIERDTRPFTIAVDTDGIRVEGNRISAVELGARAREARQRGADEAIVATARAVTAEHLIPVLAAMRTAGFATVRIPFRLETSK